MNFTNSKQKEYFEDANNLKRVFSLKGQKEKFLKDIQKLNFEIKQLKEFYENAGKIDD